MTGPLVAALYVDPRGPYPALGVDCWSWEEREQLFLSDRDARSYPGPGPIVAHPPCGPWGRLRHLSRKQPRDCALRAVEQVRAFGGVLEHPAHSLLWTAAGLPLPGAGPDAFGGYTVAVNQSDWGHVARKPTWLYLVGVPRGMLRAPPQRDPTHWISGSRKDRKGYGGRIPDGIKVCSAQLRRRTPIAFARYLIGLAQSARTERT